MPGTLKTGTGSLLRQRPSSHDLALVSRSYRGQEGHCCPIATFQIFPSAKIGRTHLSVDPELQRVLGNVVLGSPPAAS